MENDGDPDQLVSSGADCLAPGKLAVLVFSVFSRGYIQGQKEKG